MRHRYATATLALVLSLASSARTASAQGAVEQGATSGYELTLAGSVQAELDGEVRLFGVAWLVEGLDRLRPGPGLEVRAELTAWDGRRRQTLQTATTRAGEGGRFELALPIGPRPLASPQLALTVRRPGQPGRLFAFDVATRSPEQIDLLTDRHRYEPGETVHAWARLTEVASRAPVAARPLTLQLLDPSGRPTGERAVPTSAAGVASADFALPAAAENGGWTVRVSLGDGARAEPVDRSIEVSRRTVERLAARVELDQEIAAPGGELSGRVVVLTPSGAPVRGAHVELRTRGEAEPLVLTTDGEGRAPFSSHAPAFLSGDVGSETVQARVVHPAHGTITATATFLLARVRWLVSVAAEAGALVPEVASRLYVSVSDPRGRPAPAGTTLAVRGLGVASGLAEVTTDGRGLAEVPMRLPRGGAARMTAGDCAGLVATTVEVEVRTRQPVVARLCAPVALEAQVLVRAESPLAQPGAELAFSVERRSAATGRPVLVEALWAGRAVAWAWLAGRERRGTLRLPPGLQGPCRLRARPVLSEGTRQPLDAAGATAFGVGSADGVLLRPGDAFSLEVSPERELYRVREEATVRLRASGPAEQGWAALVVRDEAAHGGEEPWGLPWLREALDEAAARPGTETNERFLRAALAALLEADDEQASPPPLVPPPWLVSRRGSYAPSQGEAVGVLRDPVALAEDLRRSRLSEVMRALSAAVSRLGADEASRLGIVRASGGRLEFDPEVVQTLVARRQLSETTALTLGGQPLTLAMVRAADPSFTFDRVASQVARERLVRLLHALARLTDPDDPAAARAIAGEPPDRWLSTLVRLGMVEAAALVDPWGRPFSLGAPGRGRTPTIVISDAAPTSELASPGPDGRLGTEDDVRDPFERVAPEGTLFAVATGEDALMERLGRLAPGRTVLEAMARAYGRMGLAALEEQTRGPVDAAASEDRGGGGLAFDDEEGGMPMAASAAPAPTPGWGHARPEPEEQMAYEREGRRDSPSEEPPPEPPPPPSDSRIAAMGDIVRERFPATLLFVAELPLGGGETEARVPLADALTTYLVEAVAWTASGWSTSGLGRLRVDQEAMADAPVPTVATEGDLLRLPVRVANRTDEPLPVQVRVTAEGELALIATEPRAVTVPARDATEILVEVRLGAVGAGHVLVTAVQAESGRGLDAVRRPLEVLPDVRLARESIEELVIARDTLRLDVPPEASERGPGVLRLAAGSALFGDPAVWSEGQTGEEGLWAAWALALAGRDLPPSLGEMISRWIPTDEGERRGPPLTAALLLAAAWRDDRLSEAGARALLRGVSAALPPEDQEVDGASLGDDAAWLLVALAPVLRDAGRWPAVRQDLDELGGRLRRLASARASAVSEAPIEWALAAAALALSSPAEADPRASEMLRRSARHVVTVGHEAWLEPATTDGTVEARLEPTSLIALARIASGDPRRAVPFLRSLARVADDASGWPARGRALASGAAALLAGGPVDPEVRLDGRRVPLRLEEGLAVADLEGLGRPGRHAIEVSMPEGAMALAWVDLRYGLPWSVTPRREAQVDLDWSGEAGARDGRSALLLTVRNRGARLLTRPVVEVELPAGAELDEPTRQLLGASLAAPPSLEGRTLTLRLRPLAPGGFLRLPVPVRWSVGGSLIGLGATLWDETGREPLATRPIRVVPSRGVSIADRGAEPAGREAEASPPLPDPRPPRPSPIHPLGALPEVTR